MKFVFPLFFLLSCQLVFAQKTMTLSLDQVVDMARDDSYDVNVAEKQLERSQVSYKMFKVGLRPDLKFSGTLPSLVNRTQYFGFSNELTKVSTVNSSGSLIYDQYIPFTGGSFSLSTTLSNLYRLNEKKGNWQYQPIYFGLNQPILKFNQYKWDKKIEPLKVKVAERAFAEEQEMAALTAAGLFFDIYIGQISLEAAQVDKMNADTLYRLAQGRYGVGKIAENELLQMELSAQRAEVDIASAELNLQTNQQRLRNFLGIQERVEFDLVQPEEVPEFTVDPDKALGQALKNRKSALDFEQRKMEADLDVDRNRINPGFDISLAASFGYSGTDSIFGNVLSRPQDEESISLRVGIPIYDFGKHKTNREMAEINREITLLAIDKEQMDFEQDVLLKVQQFDLFRNQTRLAVRSFEIAIKRYDITRKRYLIGKIGVTDLNIALNEQTAARQSYMQSLKSFWNAYYDLRRITLYDFEKDEPLIFE